MEKNGNGSPSLDSQLVKKVAHLSAAAAIEAHEGGNWEDCVACWVWAQAAGAWVSAHGVSAVAFDEIMKEV